MIQKKCDLALKKSNKISGCLNREILTKAVTLFFSALVRPQLETCAVADSSFRAINDYLECAQNKGIRVM